MSLYKANNVTIVTDKGGRINNEDNAGHFELVDGEVTIICDGVGGENAGEIASKLAVNTIISSYKQNATKLDTKELFVNAIQTANKRIIQESQLDQAKKNMATTVAIAYIDKNDNALFFHVGDCRIYVIREGRVNFKTRDHSLVQQMIDKGELKEKDSFNHSKSNVILKALGKESFVDITINEKKLKPTDIILVCSDGVTDNLKDKDILSLIKKSNTHEEACHRIVDAANSFGLTNKNGKHDNLSVAVYSKKYSSGISNFKKLIIISIISLFSFIGFKYFSVEKIGKPISTVEKNNEVISIKDLFEPDSITNKYILIDSFPITDSLQNLAHHKLDSLQNFTHQKLDSLAKSLNDNPTVEIEIETILDYENETENKISSSMVQYVIKYLQSKRVDENRIKVKTVEKTNKIKQIKIRRIN